MSAPDRRANSLEKLHQYVIRFASEGVAGLNIQLLELFIHEHRLQRNVVTNYSTIVCQDCMDCNVVTDFTSLVVWLFNKRQLKRFCPDTITEDLFLEKPQVCYNIDFHSIRANIWTTFSSLIAQLDRNGCHSIPFCSTFICIGTSTWPESEEGNFKN